VKKGYRGGNDFMLETQENGYLLKFQERLSFEIIARDGLTLMSFHIEAFMKHLNVPDIYLTRIVKTQKSRPKSIQRYLRGSIEIWRKLIPNLVY
jgi:hypothetical protein